MLLGDWGDVLTVDLLEDEGYKTSEIEGYSLDKELIRVSLRRCLGLKARYRKVEPQEYGVAEMLVALMESFDRPLDDATLHLWHEMLMNGRRDLAVGRYRDHPEPMQIVSGPEWQLQVHYEAPPSEQVPREMERFVQWFNETAPKGERPLPALTRAGLAHLYFVSIHPYEDGNGRIARALSQKAIYQNLGEPTYPVLSQVFQATRQDYYNRLEISQRRLSAGSWLEYFVDAAIQAQKNSLELAGFAFEKQRLGKNVREIGINERQSNALNWLLGCRLEIINKGITADDYMRLTDAPPATATRDLKDLVSKGALRSAGALKSTRYWVNIPAPGVSSAK